MNKTTAKFTALAVTAAMLVPAASVPAFAEQAETTEVGFAQCADDSVTYINIRSGADTDSDVVGKIYNNGRMEILDETDDGWYHIQSGNVNGYIKADYVATGEDAEQIAATAGYTTAEVGAYSLNIRADMSSDSEVVGAAVEGDELEVVQDDGDWVKVVTEDGVYGYVSAQYVYTSTEYRLAETLEEEQARLDAQWLTYLASLDDETVAENVQSTQEDADAAQEAADAEYQAYLEAQAAADAAAAQVTETEAAETSVETTVETEAQTAVETTVETEAVETEAAQAESEAAAAAAAQAEADAQYQAYLEAQAQAESEAAAAAAAQAESEAAAAAAAQAESEAAAAAAAQAESEAAAAADTTTEETTNYTEETTAETEAASTSSSSTGQAIADYACQFVGNPYVYGGTSLTSGCDCSGFTMSVFANFGISLPHYSGSQMGYGTAVDASSLQAGDLVFYGAGGSQHVAIYIGGGSIVHAANESTGITITSIDWPGTPTGYRRLV